MRLLVVLMALLVALVPAAARAQPVFDDPAGLVEYAYAPYRNGDFPEEMTELFSPTLTELWDDMIERSQEMPIIDFDPFINAQDYEITDLVVSDPASTATGDRGCFLPQLRRAAGHALPSRAAGRGLEDRRHRGAGRRISVAAERAARRRPDAELSAPRAAVRVPASPPSARP